MSLFDPENEASTPWLDEDNSAQAVRRHSSCDRARHVKKNARPEKCFKKNKNLAIKGTIYQDVLQLLVTMEDAT